METYWADNAYHMTTGNSQAAYDRVRAYPGGGNPGMGQPDPARNKAFKQFCVEVP